MIRVYHNLLKNHASVEKKRDISKRIPLPGDVMSLVDLSGTYCAAYKKSDNSRFNILSAIVSFGLALTSMDKENKDATGVINPYVAQAAGRFTAVADMAVKSIALGGKSFENSYLLLAINPASHITADAIINIRTNVLTCSFHLNERITASPMTAMIIGRSIKRLTASLLNTLYAIYAKAATSTSDTTASIIWNNPAYSICDLYTTGIAIEKNMRYTSESHSNMLSFAIALFLAVLMTSAAIRNPYEANCIPGIVYSVCTIPETRITPIVIHIIFALTCVPSDRRALRKSLLIVNNKITDAASDRIQMPFTYRLNPSPHMERFLSANERMRLWILSPKRIRK